jgi:hypothetical protein
VVNGLQHHQYEELLGAYALDAVDDDERALVDAHLLTCGPCSREVSSLREVAALLATSGAEAPPGIWDRIVGELEETPPPLRLAPAPDAGGWAAPSPARAPSRRWSQRGLVALGAVAAVAAAVVGVVVVSDDNSTSRNVPVAEVLSSDVAGARAEPGTQVAQLLDPADGHVVAEIVLRPNGDGYLVSPSGPLPVLSDGIYQMWGSYGGEIVSLGTMGNAPGAVEPFHAEPGADAFMVTVEDHPVTKSEGSLAASGHFV